MNYRDTVKLWTVIRDKYGSTQLSTPYVLKGLYVQNYARQHVAGYDVTDTTSVVFLPDDSKLSSLQYRLEGMVVEINPFGPSSQKYTIVDATVARDLLLNNEVKHIECQLQVLA